MVKEMKKVQFIIGAIAWCAVLAGCQTQGTRKTNLDQPPATIDSFEAEKAKVPQIEKENVALTLGGSPGGQDSSNFAQDNNHDAQGAMTLPGGSQ
jgi:hypothetical protein